MNQIGSDERNNCETKPRARLSIGKRYFGMAFVLSQILFNPLSQAAPGDVTVFAGTGTRGHSGDGGAATSADIHPALIAIDRLGSLFFANQSSHTVRRIDAASGVITTVAGQPNVSSPYGYGGGDGIPATQTTFFSPTSLALDQYGNLYVGELQGARIRRIDSWSGIITSVAGTGSLGNTQDGAIATETPLFYVPGVAIGSTGDIYSTDIGIMAFFRTDAITKRLSIEVSGASELWWPMDIEIGLDGEVYVADSGNERIRMFSGSPLTGQTIATSSTAIDGLAVDGAGNIFFAGLGNTLSKWDVATGTTSVIANISNVTRIYEVEASDTGDVYVAASDNRIYKVEAVAVPRIPGICY